jgi:DNA polymerase-3 subunit epsilon
MVFCMQLPTTMPEKATNLPANPESRPEYYDFDLFNQPGQSRELDERALGELSYTVFDTETTGLDPSAGDEIISIGAVRVVNGRLLKHETFDQLIDPRRALSRESIQIHGITPDMLKGQPRIDAVLPAFFRFAEDTVLVAHNAAFDMRFLQLKEASTAVKFIQPVLDTLLLSAVAHPGYENAEHSLEAMAARLGIDVIGRHTALGDAIVTGEVFLKLVPLLAERGIHTLKDAREASRKTLYAKLEY